MPHLRHLARAALVATFGASAALFAAPARAQQPSGDAPAAPPPGVELPVLQNFVEAPYPPEAEKAGLEGDVTLQLDIDAAGKVTKATVINPAGHGFDEAAVEAAQKFVFQPARRNGKPLAARINYRYHFALKAAPPPANAPPPGPKTLLRGVVTMGSSADAPEGAKVRVRPAGGGAPVEVAAGADGSWSLPDLPPGKYTVDVEAPGYEPLRVEEEVTAGEATEVTYRLSPAGSGFEVVVRGERPPREVTKRTLEQRELTRIPGTNGDALRAIQNLPGVARPPGLAGLLIVRGSSPNETQVFVDGALIPLAYHFGGLSSVVPSEMLSKIDFYPGNFSAQYGRVQGGIVDIGIRSPNADGKYHGLAQADLIDARVLLEGPVPFLKNWKFIGGARRSYVDLWLKPALEQAGTDVATAPVYYDYQLFVETKPTANSTLRIGVFGADDALKLLLKDPFLQDPGAGGSLGFSTSFSRLQVVYRNQISDDLRLSAQAAIGTQNITFGLGSLFFNLDSYPLTHRLELSKRLAKGVTLNVGQDLLYTPYEIALRVPAPPRPGEPDPGPFTGRPPLVQRETGALYQPAVFTELELQPSERVRIVPGFRVDYTRETKSWDAAPRVNGRFVVRPEFPKTTLKGGLGVFNQPPEPQESSRVFGSPRIKSSRAVHYSLGTEQELTRQVEVSVEGFYKQLDNLVSRTPSVNSASFDYANFGSGYVVGVETLLRYKPDKRFFGWLAYTLSRSARRGNPDEPLRLFQYDQTHILTALGSYRLGRGWEFGARFRLVSGPLDTPCSGGLFNSAAGAYACLSGDVFGRRLPPFHQLDLRVDKRWVYDNGVKFSVYLDLLNVYNRQNVEAVSYNYNYSQSVNTTGVPIIPSLGARGEFLPHAAPRPQPRRPARAQPRPRAPPLGPGARRRRRPRRRCQRRRRLRRRLRPALGPQHATRARRPGDPALRQAGPARTARDARLRRLAALAAPRRQPAPRADPVGRRLPQPAERSVRRVLPHHRPGPLEPDPRGHRLGRRLRTHRPRADLGLYHPPRHHRPAAARRRRSLVRPELRVLRRVRRAARVRRRPAGHLAHPLPRPRHGRGPRPRRLRLGLHARLFVRHALEHAPRPARAALSGRAPGLAAPLVRLALRLRRGPGLRPRRPLPAHRTALHRRGARRLPRIQAHRRRRPRERRARRGVADRGRADVSRKHLGHLLLDRRALHAPGHARQRSRTGLDRRPRDRVASAQRAGRRRQDLGRGARQPRRHRVAEPRHLGRISRAYGRSTYKPRLWVPGL
jgi:TonB family protein